jgi:oligosaccharide repeat unit polymerase
MIALYWCLLAILLVTYGSALSRVKRNSDGLTPLLGWLIGLGFFLIAPLTILTLNGGFKQPAVYNVNGSWDEVNLANWIFFRPYLIVWLSIMLTCFVTLLAGSSRSPEGAEGGVRVRRRLERAILITMALTVADCLAMIWLQGGFWQFLVSNWYTRNLDLVDRWGGVFVAYTRLSLTNQMIFTGAAALYASLGLKERNMRWRFTALIWLFFLIEIVISGNRIFFALYLLAFLTCCWLYRRNRILVALVVAAPVFVFVFSLWGSLRGNLSQVGDSAGVQAFEVDIGDRTVTHLMGATEGSSVMLLMHMISDFGTKFNYLYGSTYTRLFTFLLPASLYPSRPPDFTSLAAQLYEPGKATSLGSTALGEAYGNFGVAGILVMPLLTWLAASSGERFARAGGRHSLMSAVSFVMFIAFVRFPFAENAMTWIAALLAIWALQLESGPGLPAEGFRRQPARGSSTVEPGSRLPADA